MLTDLSKESQIGFRLLLALSLVFVCWAIPPLAAQDGPSAEQVIDEAMALANVDQPVVETPAPIERLNLLTLVMKGGLLMIPIGVMSVLVVMLVVERAIALRREKVMPIGLVEGLGRMGAVPGVLDPRQAYRLCQQYPSATATVIRSMLLKTGRPQSEVEHAVAESSEREAGRLYAHVRWLNLIAAIAPLMGLFGTVWGMIRAFFDTTQLAAGQNKADFLAQGIYVALVTTLGGLAVAIPAAIFSHYFEGRIQSLFHQIDEMLFNLLPQVERFEGRMRVTPHSLEATEENAVPPDAADRVDPANIG
ncbi:MAG: MotA/TolQ/ExbB proton channel family protein [Pirellulaceae bacterium]|nr:MotA/TolQ/ExbB proton channel family protein [Pirellulaceae bacterium]